MTNTKILAIVAAGLALLLADSYYKRTDHYAWVIRREQLDLQCLDGVIDACPAGPSTDERMGKAYLECLQSLRGSSAPASQRRFMCLETAVDFEAGAPDE